MPAGNLSDPTHASAPQRASPPVWLSFPHSPSSGTTANGPVATSSTLAGSGWAACARSISIARPGARNGCSWTSTATRPRFVPLADASVESSTIRVAHSAAAIRSAPGIGSEPRIDQSEERRLYDHYGLGYSETDSGSGLPRRDAARPTPSEPVTASWSRGRRGGAVEPRPAARRAAVGRGARGGRAIPEPAAAESSMPARRRRPIRRPPGGPSRPDPRSSVSEPDVDGRAVRRGEILATAPETEDLKAQPGPDAVRPVDRRSSRLATSPRRPRSRRPRPARSTPSRRASGSIAVGVAIAAVLFFVIRRLR